MATYTHKYVKEQLLIMCLALFLRIPIDLEHKRLEEALDWDKVRVQTNQEALERMKLRIIQTNGVGFSNLKAFLRGYYNLRREI